MFERFTQGARVLLVLAQEEARVLQHHHIGSEHLLLALVRDDPEQLLSSAGVTLADTRERVLDLVPGKDTPPGGHIPFTASAKAVLEGALREAVEHRHQTIAPLHLLASLLRARKGEGFQVLEQVVDVATLTTAVQARLPELAVEPSRAFAVPRCPRASGRRCSRRSSCPARGRSAPTTWCARPCPTRTPLPTRPRRPPGST